jgi:hypothetical protein
VVSCWRMASTAERDVGSTCRHSSPAFVACAERSRSAKRGGTTPAGDVVPIASGVSPWEVRGGRRVAAEPCGTQGGDGPSVTQQTQSYPSTSR